MIKFIIYSIISALIFIFLFSLFFDIPMEGNIIYKVREVIQGTSTKISNTFSEEEKIFLDLKDFNENPEKYENKNVKVYAKFVSRSGYFPGGKTFADSNGYKIIVVGSDRWFDFNKWYNLNGKIILDDSHYVLKE